MANGIVTAGTKLEYNTTGSTYVQVKGLNSFSGLGGGSAAVIDMTDFDSVAKEKALGLPDEGQMSCDFIYLPKDAGQQAMRAARASRSKVKLRITLPDTTTFVFEAFVQTFEKSGQNDDKVTVSGTFEITGAITETPAV